MPPCSRRYTDNSVKITNASSGVTSLSPLVSKLRIAVASVTSWPPWTREMCTSMIKASSGVTNPSLLGSKADRPCTDTNSPSARCDAVEINLGDCAEVANEESASLNNADCGNAASPDWDAKAGEFGTHNIASAANRRRDSSGCIDRRRMFSLRCDRRFMYCPFKSSDQLIRRL